jgi:hypothetical protein
MQNTCGSHTKLTKTHQNPPASKQQTTNNKQHAVDNTYRWRIEIRLHTAQTITLTDVRLTQEQQVRTHVEDRLEDALHRLWSQSGPAAGRSKGFFSSLFGSVSSTLNGAASNTTHNISHLHTDTFPTKHVHAHHQMSELLCRWSQRFTF